MKRGLIFGFRVDTTERQMIRRVARQLHRTEADAIRFLIREAAQVAEDDMPNARPAHEVQHAQAS